jgi:hypothetical protein
MISVIRAPQAKLSNFRLNLRKVRRDCGHLGNYAILVQSSDRTEVSAVSITGSPFGDPSFSTGGANTGGINLLNSRNGRIRNNEITDVRFMVENGGNSAGQAGIQLDNSANTTIEANTIRRVSFGISINNKTAAAGFVGDSSNTTVTGNTIIGAANINCPECSPGRALKLTACGDGSESPLRSITVRYNTASEFGGANGRQGGSGLDLVCGVQFSTFEENQFTGAATAEFGLQIRGSFNSAPSRQTATHHNTFNRNTFRAGNCSTCADVNFTADGPDQIGLRRNFKGTNLYTTVRERGTGSNCGDFSHAFFAYPSGQNFITPGQSLFLATAGVRPGSQVVFRFRKASGGADVATFVSPGANGNCVMNQASFVLDAARFSPGLYTIFTDYSDGNSTAAIFDDPIAINGIEVRQMPSGSRVSGQSRSMESTLK